MGPRKIKRKIHYYALQAEFMPTFAESFSEGLQKAFEEVENHYKQRDKRRFLPYGERVVGLVLHKHDQTKRLIEGKIRSVRSDSFPQLLNIEKEKERDIDAADDEGILEVTHFVISYNDKGANIGIEYNHYGSKVYEIPYILNELLSSSSFTNAGKFKEVILTKDELPRLQSRIRRCSEFIVKVHKENFEKIKSMDGKLYTALSESIKYFESDSALLHLRFELKDGKQTNPIKDLVGRLVTKLIQNRKRSDFFEMLTVRAEDSDKADRLETFDLLIDKIKSDVTWECRPKSRVVLSDDAFGSLAIELSKKRLIKPASK